MTRKNNYDETQLIDKHFLRKEKKFRSFNSFQWSLRWKMKLVAELFGLDWDRKPSQKTKKKTFGFDFMIPDRGFLPSLIYASRFIFLLILWPFFRWLRYPWIDKISKRHFYRITDVISSKNYKNIFRLKRNNINIGRKNVKSWRFGSNGKVWGCL